MSIDQLALYLADKQCLTNSYKGINYAHAISILNNMVLFQDPESLYTRMRTFSPALLHALVKNKHLVQAPFKSERLAFVSKELLKNFYNANIKDDIEYKRPETRTVLEFIMEKGTSTRQRIIEQFKLTKEDVMAILAELRTYYQIFMFYDGSNWTIFSADILLGSESISKSSAITKLVYTIVKSYGPITVPQIMYMLQLTGGRTSTSIIELYENKRIIRGHFIENSSYEAFLAADELEFLKEFYEKYTDDKKKEIEILPSSDSLAEYWASADFSNIKNIEKELVLFSGKPICSFDFKIIGDNLHILNLNKTPEYSNNEGTIRDKIQEFAENKGKFLVFPKLQSEEIKAQSKDFAKALSQRGYSSRTQGLVYHISRFSDVESGRKLLSYSDVFNLLLDYQFLQKRKNFTSKPEVINGLLILGIPLSLSSLSIRMSQGKENLINEMIINKQLVIGKFGAFSRGYISTMDFIIYSKLSTIRQFGVLEEKALNTIIQKEKVNFNQLKESLNLSDRVLLATLHRLESAHEIIQTRSVSDQIIWYPVDNFLKGIQTKKAESQRGAWIEVLYRMLSTQLPLTINQIANITGLSNTQIEVYLKELIASRGVRSGRYFEEENEVQFTTKEVEETISSFILQIDEIQPTTEQASVIYLPRNDPLIALYRTYLLKRFKLKSIFLRALPSEYAELILINGNPVAALHFKKKEKIEYVHNIEILPEYSDTHSLMFIFSSIQDYLNKTKEKSKRQLRIKQIDGIPLYSETGKKYRNLIKDMQLDFLIQP